MISFLVGVAAAMTAAIIEAVILILGEIRASSQPVETGPGILAVLAAVEETVKFALIVRRFGGSESTLRATVSAILVGAGFGVTETIFARYAFPEAPIEALAGILVIHVVTASLYGVVVRFPSFFRGIALLGGISVHLMYNLAVIGRAA